MPFVCIYISQGSVATRLGCGGVFVNDFVTNFLLSLTVKEFWKSVNIWWSYGQELGVFFDSQRIVQILRIKQCVLQFHVLQFHAPLHSLSFSRPAISYPSFSAPPPYWRWSVRSYVPVRAGAAHDGRRLHAKSQAEQKNWEWFIIPAKARDYVFTGVGLSVCLSVCYYDTITK